MTYDLRDVRIAAASGMRKLVTKAQSPSLALGPEGLDQTPNSALAPVAIRVAVAAFHVVIRALRMLPSVS